ncbi:hypothetical protein ACOSQ2_013599 [Xanthoceras sorbifolium]
MFYLRPINLYNTIYKSDDWVAEVGILLPDDSISITLTGAENHHRNDLIRQLDTKKKRGKILTKITKGKKTHRWWDAFIDELNMEDLHQMDVAFEELSNKLHNKLNETILGGGGV